MKISFLLTIVYFCFFPYYLFLKSIIFLLGEIIEENGIEISSLPEVRYSIFEDNAPALEISNPRKGATFQLADLCPHCGKLCENQHAYASHIRHLHRDQSRNSVAIATGGPPVGHSAAVSFWIFIIWNVLDGG